MKVNDYKLEFDAAGVALLSVGTGNGCYLDVCCIDGLSGKGADEVSARVEYELSSRGIEVCDAGIGVAGGDGADVGGASYGVSISNDMSSVRARMRACLLELSSSDKNIHKKKDMLPLYDAMCKVSQVMINAAKVEYVASMKEGTKETKEGR